MRNLLQGKVAYAATTAILIASGFVPAAALARFHEVFKDKMEERREQVEQGREEFRQELKDRRNSVRDFGREVRDGMMERGEEMREDVMSHRDQLREEIKKRRDEFVGNLQVRAEEFKKKFGEKRAERIEQFFGQMAARFEAAIDRLGRAGDRIEGMINAAVEKGRDVAKAKEDLAAARAKIDQAVAGLEDAKVKYAELAKNVDPKKAFADVRALVHGVQNEVKEAHAALVRVITELRGGDAATTTPAVVPPPAQ